MPTVTLRQNAKTDASGIIAIMLKPMNVRLSGIGGGPLQFTCTNALAGIHGGTSVEITYDANQSNVRETIQVSSIMQ
ncbi:MAG: hypothetical protein KDC34_03365 [Saprospiraceae bacterium]|nr:hypothetical protein [Saprospiraceae bacterium]